MDTQKSRGIVLMAFGKRGYFFAAYNMAFSVKHFEPTTSVTLVVDSLDNCRKNLLKNTFDIFDNIIEVKEKDLYTNGKLDPGKAKVNLYKYMPYDYNLYLDVDGICLKSINPLFDDLINEGNDMVCHIVGTHTIDQGRHIPSMQWAWADDLWDHFGLKETTVLPAINSSLLFVKKGDVSANIYEVASSLYQNNPLPLAKLKMRWGGGQPDELYMNVAMAKLSYLPDTKIPKGKVDNNEEGFIHFSPSGFAKYSDIIDQYYFQSYYGNKNFLPAHYKTWIDNLMQKYHNQRGLDSPYKLVNILKDKHANKNTF